MAFESVRPLLGAIVIAAVVISLLLISLLLVPIAIWLAVRWALFVPVVEPERLSATHALRRSGRSSAGVVYAVALPFVALATAYVYFDAKVRDELEPERVPDELPAEIEFSV